jgi:hypothetical protein
MELVKKGKALCFVLTVLFVLGLNIFPGTAAYVPQVTIVMSIDSPYMSVNGVRREIDNEGSVPFIENGRTLVPIRFVAETLSAGVDWNSDTREVTLALDSRILIIPIGEITPELSVLGMDVPPKIISGRTMVPLRFISEFFDALVSWDEVTRSIEIVKG